MSNKGLLQKRLACQMRCRDELLSGDDLRFLMSLILNTRPDIKARCAGEGKLAGEFYPWLICSGIREYKAVAQSEELRRMLWRPLDSPGLFFLHAMIYMGREDLRSVFALESPQFMQWFYMHGVDEHKLHDLLPEPQRQIYEKVHGRSLPPKTEPAAGRREGFGVNLIGYARGQLGIGEHLRQVAQALKLAGIPFTVIDFAPGDNVPRNDFSIDEYVNRDGRFFDINIFCLTAPETARFYLLNGGELFRGRYNIGYWPWELEKWPEEWEDMSCLVDEIWAISRHVYDAVAPVSPMPAQIMPLPAQTGPVADKGRKDFSLPEDAYLFCFAFDLNSSIFRKNPQACLDAFLLAFPDADDASVGLVIKCHRPAEKNERWEKLTELAQKDKRIHIMEETLARPDLMALYRCCDCYLSLHRAEGFGLGMAEALLLGLRVIATAYSGNLDFCRDHPQVWLVPHELRPVGEGQYPQGEGSRWAEPDIEAAADLMRNAPHAGLCRDEKLNHELFSPAERGRRFAKRLEFLRALAKEHCA